jgi:predicted HicB family RNase H-like nuclease
LNQRKNKVGRPKMPKGQAKVSIVPVRFATNDLKAITAAAKASKLSLSEWIRGTLLAKARE